MNSDEVTSIDPRWLCGLLQLGDTFYPTGAYSHSFGLEGMVESGVVHDRETLAEYLQTAVLPALSRVEMPLVCHAHAALAEPNWARVGEVSLFSSALRMPQEARAASVAIGRQRVELLVRLRRSELATEYLRRAEAQSWPLASAVATALEARSLGAPLEAALATTYYAGVAGALAAAMKIIRIGQNAAQGLLTAALEEAPVHFAQARRLPLEEVGWYNPWLDIASSRHEHAAARLFIS